MASQTPPESTFYPVVSDDLFNEHCIRQDEAWEKKLLRPANKRLLEAFVSRKMGGRHPVQFVTTAKGSFNLVLKFRIRDGSAPETLALRFPRRGYSPKALVSEKLGNEVRWMQYFEEQHIAPVPHIHSWCSTPGSDGMDPYILMDFVEGESLYQCLDGWERTRYDSADDEKRRLVLGQLAAILLELSRPRFHKIGSITKAADGSWAVTRRPLTLDMYMHLSAIPHFPTDAWPTGPLQSANELKAFVAHVRHRQMMCQRNINIPGTWNAEGYFDFQSASNMDMARAMSTARGRLLSRRAMRLPAYAAHLNNDSRPFAIFCNDLSAHDIVVDPATGQIKALLDLEFTNAMPTAFAEDPPVWLVTFGLGLCLERGLFSGWQELFRLAMEAFLAALEQVELERGEAAPSPPLSRFMRSSWSGQLFLVNCALNRNEMTDILYHQVPALFPELDPLDVSDEIKRYQEHTVHQIAAYEEERALLQSSLLKNET